ncbi:hypothetical protein TWF281_003782 [Arthrobotrys megalospora]
MGRGTRKTPKKKSKPPRRTPSSQSGSPSSGRSPGRGGRANIILKKQIRSAESVNEEYGSPAPQETTLKAPERRDNTTPKSESPGNGQRWIVNDDIGGPKPNPQRSLYGYSEHRNNGYERNESGEDAWSLNQLVRDGVQSVRDFVEGSMREVRQYLPSPESSEDSSSIQGDVESPRSLHGEQGSERSDREMLSVSPVGEGRLSKQSYENQILQIEDKPGLRMAETRSSKGSGDGSKESGGGGEKSDDGTKKGSGDGGGGKKSSKPKDKPSDSAPGDKRGTGGGGAKSDGSGSTTGGAGPSSHRPARPRIGRDASSRGDRASFRPGVGGSSGSAIPRPRTGGSSTGTTGGGPKPPDTRTGVTDGKAKVTDDKAKDSSGKPKASDGGPKASDGKLEASDGGPKTPSGKPPSFGSATDVDDSLVTYPDGGSDFVKPVRDYSKLKVAAGKRRPRGKSPGRDVLTPGPADAQGVKLMLPAQGSRPWPRGTWIIGDKIPQTTFGELKHPPGLKPVPPPPPRPPTPAIALKPPDDAQVFELSNPRNPTYLLPPKQRGGWQSTAHMPHQKGGRKHRHKHKHRPPKLTLNPVGGPPMIPPRLPGGGGGGPPDDDGLAPIFQNPGCPQSGAMLIGVIVSVGFILAYMLGGRQKERKKQAGRQSRLSRFLESKSASKLLSGLPASVTNTAGKFRTRVSRWKWVLTKAHDAVPMSERVGRIPPLTIGPKLREGDHLKAPIDHRAEVLRKLGLPDSATWEDINLHLNNKKKVKYSRDPQLKPASGTGGEIYTAGALPRDTTTVTSRFVSTAIQYRDISGLVGPEKAMLRAKPQRWGLKDWRMYTRIPMEISWCPAIDLKECLPAGKDTETAIDNVLAEVEQTLKYFRAAVKKQKEFRDKGNKHPVTLASGSRPKVPPITSTISSTDLPSLPSLLMGGLEYGWGILFPCIWGFLKGFFWVFAGPIVGIFKAIARLFDQGISIPGIIEFLRRLYINYRIMYQIPPEKGFLYTLFVLGAAGVGELLRYWFPPLEYYFNPRFFVSHPTAQAVTILRVVVWYQLGTLQLIIALAWPILIILRILHPFFKFFSSTYRSHYDDFARLAQHGGGKNSRICHAILQMIKANFGWFDLRWIELARGTVWRGPQKWLVIRISDLIWGTAKWWMSSPRLLLSAVAMVISRQVKARFSLWDGIKRIWTDFFKPPVMFVVWIVWIAKAMPVVISFCLVKAMVFIWGLIGWFIGGPQGNVRRGSGPLGQSRAPMTPHRTQGGQGLTPGGLSFMTPGGTRHPVPHTIDRRLLRSERRIRQTTDVKLRQEEQLRRIRVMVAETRSNLEIFRRELHAVTTTAARRSEVEMEIYHLENLLNRLKMAMITAVRRVNSAREALRTSVEQYNQDQEAFSRDITRMDRYRGPGFRGDSEFRGLTPAESRVVIERNMVEMGIPVRVPAPLPRVPDEPVGGEGGAASMGGLFSPIPFEEAGTGTTMEPLLTTTEGETSTTEAGPAAAISAPLPTGTEVSTGEASGVIVPTTTANLENGLRRHSREREASVEHTPEVLPREGLMEIETPRDAPIHGTRTPLDPLVDETAPEPTLEILTGSARETFPEPTRVTGIEPTEDLVVETAESIVVNPAEEVGSRLPRVNTEEVVLYDEHTRAGENVLEPVEDGVEEINEARGGLNRDGDPTTATEEPAPTYTETPGPGGTLEDNNEEGADTLEDAEQETTEEPAPTITDPPVSQLEPRPENVAPSQPLASSGVELLPQELVARLTLHEGIAGLEEGIAGLEQDGLYEELVRRTRANVTTIDTAGGSSATVADVSSGVPDVPAETPSSSTVLPNTQNNAEEALGGDAPSRATTDPISTANIPTSSRLETGIQGTSSASATAIESLGSGGTEPTDPGTNRRPRDSSTSQSGPTRIPQPSQGPASDRRGSESLPQTPTTPTQSSLRPSTNFNTGMGRPPTESRSRRSDSRDPRIGQLKPQYSVPHSSRIPRPNTSAGSPGGSNTRLPMFGPPGTGSNINRVGVTHIPSVPSNTGAGRSPTDSPPRPRRSVLDLYPPENFGWMYGRSSQSPTAGTSPTTPRSSTAEPPSASSPRTPQKATASTLAVESPIIPTPSTPVKPSAETTSAGSSRIPRLPTNPIPSRSERSAAPFPDIPSSRRIKPPTLEDLLPTEENTPMRKNVFTSQAVEQYYKIEEERVAREEAEEREREEKAEKERKRAEDLAARGETPESRAEADELIRHHLEMRRQMRSSRPPRTPTTQQGTRPHKGEDSDKKDGSGKA